MLCVHRNKDPIPTLWEDVQGFLLNITLVRPVFCRINLFSHKNHLLQSLHIIFFNSQFFNIFNSFLVKGKRFCFFINSLRIFLFFRCFGVFLCLKSFVAFVMTIVKFDSDFILLVLQYVH